MPVGPIARRTVLIGAGAVAGGLLARTVMREDRPEGSVFPAEPMAGEGDILNDASLLSPTRVAAHVTLSNDRRDALVTSLQAELAQARSAGRPVVVSAARHSMGGQSLVANGSVVTLDKGWLETDIQNRTCRVSAGMRWSEVIARLDAIGFSPKVMQSNNDFGVASTFSVNAHGWPVPWSAFGSTVRSILLMLASGELATCSRRENTELFNLAMGGYGLVGAIVELEMEIVPNRNLEPTFERLPGDQFGKRFVEVLKSDPTIEMAYGRLDVTIDSFFDEALLITYRPAADQSHLPAASGSGIVSHVAAKIFRAQLRSDRVKTLRWAMETTIGPSMASGLATRNSLMNEPAVTLDDGDPTRTDILHEYFLSPDRFADFMAACRDIIPSSYQELLNVTLRFVDTDRDSVLAYATGPRIAAVMLFSQEMTVRGEGDMARMTSALIERVLEIGGTYYLPYRPHARPDQFVRGYRRAEEFAAAKRRLDPDLMFRNGLWGNYIAAL